MRGLFHFSIVILGGERETSAPRGVCAGCTGCSVISVQRWCSTGSAFKAPRVSEMSFMCGPRASLSMRPDGHCSWSSLSLSSSSVQPRSGNPRTAPHTSRSVPEDKCEDDPKMMFPLRMAVCSERSLGCSGLQWQFVRVVFG